MLGKSLLIVLLTTATGCANKPTSREAVDRADNLRERNDADLERNDSRKLNDLRRRAYVREKDDD